MKTITKIITSAIMLFITIMTAPAAFGTSYTAVTSGNWSSAATWGGAVPPTTLILDQVTIPSGITVTMDNSVIVSGITAKIDVTGTLTSSNKSLLVTSGLVTGSGTLSVDSLNFNITTAAVFT